MYRKVESGTETTIGPQNKRYMEERMDEDERSKAD